MTIGEKFKTVRILQSKTLREVEKSTGISNAYLSQLETGHIKKPSYDKIKILSDYYGIKTDVGDMDELTMLISTMTEIEVTTLTLFAKFIINNRKNETDTAGNNT